MHRAAVAVAPAYRGRMLNTRAQWSAEFETGAGTHVKNSNGDVVPGQCAKTKAGHHRGANRIWVIGVADRARARGDAPAS